MSAVNVEVDSAVSYKVTQKLLSPFLLSLFGPSLLIIPQLNLISFAALSGR